MNNLDSKEFDGNNLAETWRTLRRLKASEELNVDEMSIIRAAMDIVASALENGSSVSHTTLKEEMVPISQWCEENGVDLNTVQIRIKRGAMPHRLINGRRCLPRDYIFLDNRNKALLRVYRHKSLDLSRDEVVKDYQSGTHPEGVSISYYDGYLIAEPEDMLTIVEPRGDKSFVLLK